MNAAGPPARRQAAAWGALFGYATLGCIVARNVLLVPLYLAFISLEEYGAWLATGGALVQLLVSDYGVSGVILQRVAAAHGAGDKSRISEALGAALASSLILTVVLGGVSIGITPFIPQLLDLDSDSGRRVIDCFLIAIAANALSVFGTIGTSVLRGLQRAIAPGGIQLGAELVLIGTTVLLLYAGHGLYALAWAMLVRSVVATSGVAFAAARTARGELDVHPRFAMAEGRRLLVDSTSLFLVSVSMKLLSRSDVLLVGTVLNARAAAVYGLTTRLIDTVTMFLSQLNVALAPGLAHLFGSGNQARFHALLNRLVPVLGALTLAGLGTAAAVSRDFVALWVGPEQFGGTGLAYLFAAAACVSAVGYIGYDALMAAARFRFIAIVFVSCAAGQLVLALALLQGGPAGVPAAALVASLVWGSLFWREVLALGADGRQDRARAAGSLGVATVVTAAVLAVATLLPPATTWWSLALKTAGIGATAVAAIAAASPWIRRAAREEVGATLRLWRRPA